MPHDMTQAEIETFVDDFVDTTKCTLQPDGKVREMYAAHGYLLHNFPSPPSNHRTDNYSGSSENRTLLAAEVATQVRAAWSGDLSLFFSISLVDGTIDMWFIQDSVKLTSYLKTIRVDVIYRSSGDSFGSATIRNKKNYDRDFKFSIQHK